MAEIIKLGKARKARAKEAAERDATANRAKHGRTKEQKLRDAEAEERRRRLLDGARRDEG